MQIAYLALISLQLIGTLATPFYLRLRGHMSDHKVKYSKRRIFKDIVLHFLMMSFITAHFIVILYSILNSSTEVSSQLLFYSSLQLIFLGAALYGSGMYIVAILFESAVRKNFSIVRLIHGPISHSIMYGAYLASFGNLINLSQTAVGDTTLYPPLLFVVLGIIGGYSIAISAISSGISFQYSILASIIGVLFLSGKDLANPFALHFCGLMGVSLLVGIFYCRWTVKRHKRILWYHPINVTKIKF